MQRPRALLRRGSHPLHHSVPMPACHYSVHLTLGSVPHLSSEAVNLKMLVALHYLMSERLGAAVVF